MLFRGDPDPGLDVAGAPIAVQIVKPGSRNLQLAGFEVALDHKEGMELLRVLGNLSPHAGPGQLFRIRLDQVSLRESRFGRLAGAGQRRGVVVHHRGFGLLAQRQRQRRRLFGLQLAHPDRAGADPGQNAADTVEVPMVLKAFAARLSDQGMTFLVGQGIEQLSRAHALHPERLAAGLAQAHHQGTGGVVAEHDVEQGCQRQRRSQDAFGGFGPQAQEQVVRQLGVTVGEQQKTVIVGDVTDDGAGQALGLLRSQYGQRFVDLAAKDRMDHQLPGAVFIAEMFGQQRPVVGQHAGHGDLAAEHGLGCLRVLRVQTQFLQRLDQAGAVMGFAQAAQQGAEGLARLQAAAADVTFPKRRQGTGAAGLGDDDGVLLHLADFPGKGAEQELVAQARLKDKLLVQLAQDDPLFGTHRVETAVRDGAARRDGQQAAVAVAADLPAEAVVKQAGTDRDIARVLFVAGQHFQHRAHIVARHVAERVRPGQQGQHLVQVVAAADCQRNQVLGQHIEAQPRRTARFHAAGAHHLGRQAAGERFGRGAREHQHHADPARVVAGPAQTLQGAGNRPRAADLDHQVDLADIDAQLHRGGGAQQPHRTGAQGLLDVKALLAGQAAVMGAGKRFPAQLVDEIGQLLGIGPGLDKGDHAAGLEAVPVDALGDRLPDGVLARFLEI